MAAGLIGRKIGMTQMFAEDGRRLPVTVLQVGPCPVVAKKTLDRDGYDAVQLGFLEQKPSRISKPVKGQFANAKVAPTQFLREFRVDDPEQYQIGDLLKVDRFEVDRFVDVTGRSIGKGFAGVVKRWGFKGGRASHGAHKTHRAPGSIGQCQYPGRVFKNKKMAGHMGDITVTVQNLQIAGVDVEKNLLMVKGGIPGSKGSLVLIRNAIKKGGS
ncbi:MAG: 50S ribosomal protein L3 [Magnetococcales bacterium]|nr:50S ribosomal protein L3 [Magnetococcales bacterium]